MESGVCAIRFSVRISIEVSIRLISRLDIKTSHLIKGVQMEGWRRVGDPAKQAEKYYLEGVDEILYLDVVASLYQRNSLHHILRDVASRVFVPITVAGGITSVSVAKSLMEFGADKLAINTAAIKQPAFITELSNTFGSQAVVLNLEAKKIRGGVWTVMTDNGRNPTGRDAVAWAVEAANSGAGEILVTSIDYDGSQRGMDFDLISAISREVDIPIIASGGCGSAEHARSAIESGADAVAIGAALHKNDLSLLKLRSDLCKWGYDLRPLPIC